MLHIASFLALYTAQEEYSTKIASQSVCALSGLLVKIFTLSSLFVSFPLNRFSLVSLVLLIDIVCQKNEILVAPGILLQGDPKRL